MNLRLIPHNLYGPYFTVLLFSLDYLDIDHGRLRGLSIS